MSASTPNIYMQNRETSSAQRASCRADEVVRDVVKVLSPLLNISELDQFEEELLRLAHVAISVCAEADESHFIIESKLDRADHAKWRSDILEPLLGDDGEAGIGIPSSTRERMYTLFPRIVAHKYIKAAENPSKLPGSWHNEGATTTCDRGIIHSTWHRLPEWSRLVVRGQEEEKETKEELRRAAEEKRKERNDRNVKIGTHSRTGTLTSISAQWMMNGGNKQVTEQIIYKVKLLLDESQQSRYGPSVRSKKILTMFGKDPVSVASDYLRELLAVVKGTQTRRLGETYVRSAKFRIVLTVPAVWSDKAKDATLRAAEDGLGDHQLIMISEPEAAALHTLRAIQPNTITVLRSVEPLELYEVVQGDGGICGAAMLDKRFETFIKHRLGAQWSQLSEKSKNMTLSCWENNIKCNFSGTGAGDNEDDLTEFLIVIPGVSDNVEKGIEGGMMLVERFECKSGGKSCY
ncbi:hypothetical protein ACLOAV_009899 [Pseudogymnoascus australis]